MIGDRGIGAQENRREEGYRRREVWTPPPLPRISSVGHPILCNVSLGGGTTIRKISTDQLLVKEKRGMGAQENRGRKGYGRREVWTTCISTVGHPILCITMYVIRWWHRSHTTKLICNLGPVYMEEGDPRKVR